MKKDVFIKKIDEVAEILERYDQFSCLLIQDLISKKARSQYEEIFNTSKVKIPTQYHLGKWIHSSPLFAKGSFQDIANMRKMLIQMFKYICLEEKLYRRF